MARIRSVHPGLFSDEAFVSCSPTARLLVIGLWTEADDKGIFEWKPLTIKMRIFPADGFDVSAMSAFLDELLDSNIVERFELDGKSFGAIRNFRKYQRPQKPNDIHPMPDALRDYVGLNAPIQGKVAYQSRIGTRKSNQMEDVGGRMEEEGEKHNRSTSKEEVTSQGRSIRTRERVDADGVVLEDEWGGAE